MSIAKSGSTADWTRMVAKRIGGPIVYGGSAACDVQAAGAVRCRLGISRAWVRRAGRLDPALGPTLGRLNFR